jgi:hypothetical protein
MAARPDLMGRFEVFGRAWNLIDLGGGILAHYPVDCGKRLETSADRTQWLN